MQLRSFVAGLLVAMLLSAAANGQHLQSDGGDHRLNASYPTGNSDHETAAEDVKYQPGTRLLLTSAAVIVLLIFARAVWTIAGAKPELVTAPAPGLSIRRAWQSLILAVVAAWLLITLGLHALASSAAASAAIGDSFGAANSLFAGLGFCGLVITLMLQISQLRVQVEEQHEARIAMRDQAEAVALTTYLAIFGNSSAATLGDDRRREQSHSEFSEDQQQNERMQRLIDSLSPKIDRIVARFELDQQLGEIFEQLHTHALLVRRVLVAAAEGHTAVGSAEWEDIKTRLTSAVALAKQLERERSTPLREAFEKLAAGVKKSFGEGRRGRANRSRMLAVCDQILQVIQQQTTR